MKDSEIYPYVHHIEEEVKIITKIIKRLNSITTFRQQEYVENIKIVDIK